VPKDIQEPLECFDFHWQVYARTPKEKLLEFVATWPDAASLARLMQPDAFRQDEINVSYCSFFTIFLGRHGAIFAQKGDSVRKENFILRSYRY
jgi:hypothetical protein